MVVSFEEMVRNERWRKTSTVKSYRKVWDFPHEPLLLVLLISPSWRNTAAITANTETKQQENLFQDQEARDQPSNYLIKTDRSLDDHCWLSAPAPLSLETTTQKLQVPSAQSGLLRLQEEHPCFLLFPSSLQQTSANTLNGFLPRYGTFRLQKCLWAVGSWGDAYPLACRAMNSLRWWRYFIYTVVFKREVKKKDAVFATGKDEEGPPETDSNESLPYKGALTQRQ